MYYIAKPPLEELMHYGIKRRSGRYPWGSGENPFQHDGDFAGWVDKKRKEGFTFTDENGKVWTGDTAIAKSIGMSTTDFRTEYSLDIAARRSQDVATAKMLRDEGLSLNEIAKQMGYKNDSSVRSLLNADSEARMNEAQKTADIIREAIETKGMIDVGAGVERELGNVSREKFEQALYILEREGYPTYSGGVPQVTNKGQQTILKVICPKGTEHKAIYNYEDVHSLKDYKTDDGGETYHKSFVYPSSMDSKRLSICYAEEGGKDKDGLIEIRRGVPDLSLGESNYAQVRIMVDGTHYLKGMAVYSDDLPKGVDVRFNTNKSVGTPMTKVLKPIKSDPDNPFGSLIKENGGQSYYTDKNGEQKLSLINKRSDEGDWTHWSNKLPSQFLSKQNKSLIKKQLNLAIADKQSEYDEICALTNPTVKKYLLSSFANDCDSAAVHLYAAALPRQKYKVILPVTTLKDTEVYAPDYKNGEKVALIRYPHGGTFEIPILTVNNKQADAKKMLANAKDAIGINSAVAGRLSGADFDGDTVMVIPCNSSNSSVKITSTHPLKGLEGFDPTMAYGGKEEGTFKIMKDTQKQMGVISNLITDMTLKGATESELARAVRHSMVVIDAEKHKLDYKQSEIDNGIAALKKKYQGHYDEEGNYHEGAATLISRAKSEKPVTKRRGSPQIDPETGKVSYKESYESYVDPKTGKVKVRTQASTKMAETDDAMTLVSDYRSEVELAYADYANKLKALANQARKESLSKEKVAYSSAAKATYQEEVDHLNAQLNVALKNAPRERQAQLIANSQVTRKKADNPDMTKEEIKKASQQALTAARNAVGAERTTITISDKEWEAIQAGAISETALLKILNNTDLDNVRQLATPRSSNSNTLAVSKQNMIKNMSASGYSIDEIAERLGVSTSTVSKYM